MRYLLGLLLLVSVLPSIAHAHPFAPGAVMLEEHDGEVRMTARLPFRVRPGERPSLALPEDCEVLEDPIASRTATHIVLVSRVRCDEPLRGRRVSLEGIAPNGTTLLVSFEGQEWLLDWRQPSVELGGGSFGAFFELGVRHLLAGLDHVLLVVGLTFLLGFRRKLGLAMLAFTMGHACALTAMMWLDFWPSVMIVEGAIALTLIGLGLEIGQSGSENKRESWLSRWPAMLPLLIGLIHGCGFAGALRETGLSNITSVLIPFHLGLEAAQLVVVAVTALALPLLRKAIKEERVRARTVGAVVGGAAMMLLFPG